VIKSDEATHQKDVDSSSMLLAATPGSVKPGESLGCAQPARLRTVFEAEWDFVWRLLRRLGLREVDDAAQHVFLIFARKIASVDEGKEHSFLYGTALRVAKDMRESQNRRDARSSELSEAIDSEIDVERLVDRKRARELLDRILDAMDFDLRSVFVLYELERLTAREIADMLGIAQGTVASRLRRAREEFEARVAAHAKGGSR
jgi:RNA polymerase sigma-70 factor (ECF subfamily)